MIVVGGTYWEHTIRPEWSELRGSGLRAAIALAEVEKTSLVTCVAPDSKALLNEYGITYGIDVEAHDSSESIVFQHVTTLSVPIITPRPDMVARTSIDVVGDVVLCFGMLECDWKVRARLAVYDPQLPRPRSFAANSSADRLALVANGDELKRWAGLEDVIEAAHAVRTLESAEIVVVKQGLWGATIVTNEGASSVPAYVSRGAWTLGSGDIFSSAFAYFWGVRRMPAVKAATLASQAVAFYATERTHPRFDESAIASMDLEALVPIAGSVYLAGPFFSLSERWLVEEARANLKSLGLEVKSPYHHTKSNDPRVFAPADIDLLKNSGRMFALLDGFDPGTLLEIGVAESLDIPIVCFSRHAPFAQDERLNMLRGLGVEIYDDYAYAMNRVLQVGRS